jgi:PAS domain S-box-containing protein
MPDAVDAQDSAPPGSPLDPELLQLFISSVVDYAMFILDPTGHILTWNEGARRIKGYEASEIIGKHFSIFYPAVDIRRGKPQFELTAAAAEGRFEDEGWRLRKDGTRFWANVIITGLFKDDRLVGYAKVTRDLTERRQAEEERGQLLQLERNARESAEQAVEQLRTLQEVTEAGLTYLHLDDMLEQLLERVRNALAADTAAILLLEEDVLVARAAKGIEEEVEQGVRVPLGRGFAGRVAAERRAVIIEDVNRAEVVNPLLRQKGIRSLLGVPLIVEGRVLGVLHIGALTQRKFTEQDVVLLQLVGDRAAMAIEHARLNEAERAARQQRDAAQALVTELDSFLSVAAHELKTPVTALNGLFQLLERRLNRPNVTIEEVRTALPAIGRQASKLVQLVNNLLDISRLSSGRIDLALEVRDVRALVADVMEAIQLQTSDHALILSGPEGLMAEVDPLRMDEVLTNLLDNAVKFSPAGGSIEVTLRSVDRLVEVRVRDHGLGVPPEHRAAIFDRFYQAHSESYRSGLGLGLSISREIVQLHGGTLHAEFPSDGGTLMIVRVPQAQEPRNPPGRPGTDVLVVDDDAVIRDMVLEALNDEGYGGRAAANGAEALQMVRELRPAVILLDMRMPVMDGWEFARAYQSLPEPKAPIVVMTAASDAGGRAEEIGAGAWLGKPFDLADLFEVVRRHLETSAVN